MVIPNNSSVVAIGAHPDDIEISCGGFLLFLKAKHNCKIITIVCSKGELKNNPAKREKEQLKANRLLGIDKNYSFSFKGGYLRHDKDLVFEIEKVLTKHSPSLVLVHNPSDYHQDHQAVSLATVSAARKMKTDIFFYPSLGKFSSFRANFFVDISPFFNKKVELVNYFRSNLTDPSQIGEQLSIIAREAGLRIGRQYAEEYQVYYSSFNTDE